MKKVILAVITVTVLLAILVTMLPACAPAPGVTPSPTPAPEEQVFEWRLQSHAPVGDYETEVGIPEQYIPYIEEASGGRLKITYFYEGEIVPPDEIPIAVGDGVCEMGMGPGSYWVGLDPALDLVNSLPGTGRDPSGDAFAFQNSGRYSRMVREILAEMNCQFAGWHSYGAYPIICSNVPIRKISDYEGVKVRASGYSSKLFDVMGAATTYIPGSEVYEALMLGTIDIGTWSEEAIKDMKWGEIMKYLIRPSFIDNGGCIAFVNMDAWNSLPADLQQVLIDANYNMHDLMIKGMYEYVGYNNNEGAKHFGYEVIYLPDEEVEKMWKLVAEEVWAPYAAQSPRCAESIRIVKDWYRMD